MDKYQIVAKIIKAVGELNYEPIGTDNKDLVDTLSYEMGRQDSIEYMHRKISEIIKSDIE